MISEKHILATEATHGALIAKLIELNPNKVNWVFSHSTLAARHLAEDFAFFHTWNRSVEELPYESLIFPELLDDNGSEKSGPEYFSRYCDRLEILQKLSIVKNNNIPLILFTTPKALQQEIPKKEEILQRKIQLEVGQEFDFDQLKTTLSDDLGYFTEALCEGPGQYSIRGGILDVYPVNLPYPIRIDFFGDEVEDIKSFDPTNQKSENPLNQIDILPSPEELRHSMGSIQDYLQESTHFFFIDSSNLKDENPEFFYSSHRNLSLFDRIFQRKKKGNSKDRLFEIQENSFAGWIDSFKPKVVKHNSESLIHYRDFPLLDALGLEMLESEQLARRRFLRTLFDWHKAELQIVIVAENLSEKDRILQILSEEASVEGLQPKFIIGSLSQGFVYRFSRFKSSLRFPESGIKKGFVLVTSHEFLGRKRKRNVNFQRKKKAIHKQIDQILDFNELATGDHLVHLQHGICIFRGIQHLDIHGTEEEVISIEFANEVLVHLPLAETHLLSRYVGLAKTFPKLGKPGSKNWEKARAQAEKATLDLAGELLRIQAERDSLKGFACEQDNEWQQEFESAFTHKETPDQLKAIVDTKEDMEKIHPMDRLVCGDVGYGKTEVAIRAAFKAVMNGKQVAILVPTTILCQQHLNTFRDRMAGYPISIEMLSRFRTPAEQKKTLKQVSRGQVDILVGTHRLLGKDVHFHDLGLLVVDEEQRFGVKHKERLKQMRATMDILTLSATPIPRTLYMALSGARELSTIETSPVDRLPIETYVKGYDDSIIKQAIQREISRGGQVFYLHNRVGTIEQTAKHLRTLFPKLEIAVGHGQMTENYLERIMVDFVQGRYHVLVCTTIIETGLDIPNCNTMIIEGADRFGLSQLYQLRGRIGRFKQQAYAYLLLNRKGAILGKARKRLASIKQFNQLGAGFRIAMQDLELRGAGNLLGAEQSGHIAGVGFDLYCQLLKQSVSRLKGEAIGSIIRAEVKLDFLTAPKTHKKSLGLFSDFDPPENIPYLIAEIPENYVSEASLRIQFYRKFAQADQIEDLLDLNREMLDRFGNPPLGFIAFTEMHKIRCLAQSKEFISIESKGEKLMCRKKRSQSEPYLKIGNRFPRLTNREPLIKLGEIFNYIESYHLKA
jgi:transcription-repair coupling factor (superfamily II helicase)